jgi:hypothetical protein
MPEDKTLNQRRANGRSVIPPRSFIGECWM